MSKNLPHKWHFFFTNDALTVLRSMQRGHRLATFRKLRQLVNVDAPFELAFVQSLQGEKYAEIRKFRVGDYRILFTLDSNPVTINKFDYKGTVVVLGIGQRKDVYRP